MKLNEIKNKPGAMKARKRVGRGIGSGVGKTSRRGVKGQKSRSGVAINGYEGGQMPIHMRLPKRGFNAPFSKKFNIVSIGAVQAAVDAGKIDGAQPVTVEVLRDAGLVRRAKDGVRLLGDGEIKTALTFEIAGASKSAITAVEGAGGRVNLLNA